jgi:hypothetical protein
MTSHIPSINKNLSKFCSINWLDLKMVGAEAEDFRQDILVNILSRKGSEKAYEEPYSYPFINMIAHREIIEQKRKKYGRKKRQYCGSPVSFISTATPVGHKEKNMTLGDFLEADKDLALVLVELLESCPTGKVSRKADMTWCELFKRSLRENTEEIALDAGVTPARVRMWQKKLCKYLKAA